MENIIIKPIITEKSAKLANSGRFSFVVSKKASKGSIEKEINEKFKVKVIEVNTLAVFGKEKRVYSSRIRKSFSTSPYKKAVVRLEKGQKIDVFDPVLEKQKKKKEK